jgi:hypothetical protein
MSTATNRSIGDSLLLGKEAWLDSMTFARRDTKFNSGWRLAKQYETNIHSNTGRNSSRNNWSCRCRNLSKQAVDLDDHHEHDQQLVIIIIVADGQ